MNFEAQVTFVNGVTDPDPVATPEDVPANRLITIPARRPGTDQETTRLLGALNAPAGEGVSFEVWALDAATAPDPNTDDPNDPAALAARRFYRLAAAFTLDGTLVEEVLGTGSPMAGGGVLYLRQTADTLTAARQAKFRGGV